jgi:F-type H+-transporting ATPase subunit epsilon
MATFTLRVVTIEKVAFEGEVSSLTMETEAGATNVLPGHIPLLTTLRPGVIRFVSAGREVRLVASHGSFEIKDNVATLLVGEAVPVDQIDAERAQAERSQLLNMLESGDLTVMQLRDRRRELAALNAKLAASKKR